MQYVQFSPIVLCICAHSTDFRRGSGGWSTPKNGVSNYQTYCMTLLRVVGDGKMEDDYTKALMALQKSHVWSRFPNFQNYYTNQWAPKKKVKRSIVVPYCINISPGLEEELFIFVCLQMWVQAFRVGRQLYDNTNNGVEAQNKMFKYPFVSELLPEHVDVEAHLLAHPHICARTNCEVSQCEYLN